MKEKTKLQAMFYFTVGYLLLFTILAILSHNYEFLLYTIVLSILIGIVTFYYKELHLTEHIAAGLTVLGALHIFGGNIKIAGTRLYDIWLIPPNVFKYDNLVHAFGIFVATFVVYALIYHHLDKKIKHNHLLLSLLLIFMAMGLGSFNELIELAAVIFLGAAKAVGDYYNNAFDLLFNLLGAITACIFIMYSRKKI